jgi:hypothetical protein
MLDNSSSEEEAFDTEELAQKFDWSSPRRRKKNVPSQEKVNVADVIDGMYARLHNYVYKSVHIVVYMRPDTWAGRRLGRISMFITRYLNTCVNLLQTHISRLKKVCDADNFLDNGIELGIDNGILNMVEVNTCIHAHRKYLHSPERLHTCMSHNSGAVIKLYRH